MQNLIKALGSKEMMDAYLELNKTEDIINEIRDYAETNEIKQPRLTVLEYFTAKAMQGMLSACQGFDSKGMDYLAECAVLQASAVLSHLEKLESMNEDLKPIAERQAPI